MNVIEEVYPISDRRPMWWKAPMGRLEIVGIVEGGVCVCSPVFRPQAQSDPLRTSAGRLTSCNTQMRAVIRTFCLTIIFDTNSSDY